MQQYHVSLYQSGQYIGQIRLKAKKAGAGDACPFLIAYNGQWRPAYINAYGNLSLDINHMPATAPQPRPQVTARVAPSPQPATTTYEQWKAGKLGHGPKVAAPRGKGREWADRFYCESTLYTVMRWRNSDHTTKQYRAGSYNDRRRRGVKSATKEAWDRAMAPAYAMYEQPIPDGIDPGGWWQTLREVIGECRQEARYYLYLAHG